MCELPYEEGDLCMYGISLGESCHIRKVQELPYEEGDLCMYGISLGESCHIRKVLELPYEEGDLCMYGISNEHAPSDRVLPRGKYL